MFFVPYVLFQPPMTVLIRKIGPTIFLGTIVMTWAVIMIVCFTNIVKLAPYVDILISDHLGNWVRQELGPTSRTACSTWSFGSRVLPRLCISSFLLVYSM